MMCDATGRPDDTIDGLKEAPFDRRGVEGVHGWEKGGRVEAEPCTTTPVA